MPDSDNVEKTKLCRFRFPEAAQLFFYLISTDVYL